ncbi:MAG: MATE family efflux transporter [Gemmatimonadetes bacterium]|nr:MATE family efflux transporter [Gemmatimonadota bacterium]MYB99714.1 MATE family efflux transporter [Gemmatimonadota bacterium]
MSASAAATPRARLSAFRPGRVELRALAALALPVAVVQMGLVAQGLVDTAMVGRVDAAQLGAVTLGNLYFFTVAVFGMGLLLALDPLVSQAFGAGDEDAIEVAIQRGVVLSVTLAVVASVFLAVAEPVFVLLRQPQEVVPVAAAYARTQIPGMLPFYGFIVFRQVLQAVGRVAPVVWTILLANVLNAFLNWILVFGNLGVPELGAVGSGWATAISRWFMWLCSLALGWRVLAPYLRRMRRGLFAADPFRRIVRLGSPIGLQLFLEFGAFGAIGILMGWMGTVAIAGHQIALNLAAFAFMIPLGISQAAAILVGRAVGRGDSATARRSAGGAVLICCLVMVATAAVFLGLPGVLADQFTTETRVAAVAAALIPVAGMFQLFDGLQVVCTGALRGVADTMRPMIYNVLGFWLFGMPLSLWLGFRADMGPEGLWWGLAGGLGVVAVLLLGRIWIRLRGPLERFSLTHGG